MTSFTRKHPFGGLSLLLFILCLGFSHVSAGISSAEKVRLSIHLGGSPLPPPTVGLKVGNQMGTVDANRDMELWLDAPGIYAISPTGREGCRIDRIHADDTGDKIAITGEQEPTLQLYAGARAYYRIFFEISCRDDNSPSGNDSLINPTKNVFGLNEAISIDYSNSKGSGWDFVTVVSPATPPGDFNPVTSGHSRKLDDNDNSLKERRGTKNFAALPEGNYEVRYVAWYYDGMAGANKVLKSVPFSVGKPTTGPQPNGDGTPSLAKDLTGLWKNPGSKAIYRLRQVGSKVVWGMDAVSLGSYANIFQGKISGNMIDGVWEDLPGSPTIGGGRMLLKVESECRFVRVSSVNPYGADVWVKRGSTCDAVSQSHRTDPAGTAQRAQPKVEEIPEDVIAPANTAGANKPTPRVEEIPEDVISPSNPTATNKPTPRVEEIPEDEITVAKNDDGDVFVNQPTTEPVRPKPSPKPQKTPKPQKPKKEGPGFWERLGGAINQSITTNQGTGQTGQTGGGQPSAPSGGSCGGRPLFGVDRVRVNESFYVRWPAPANPTAGDWIGTFPEGVTPNGNSHVAGWQYVSKGTGCGVLIQAPGTPGRHYVYYFHNNSYTPIGSGALLTVDP